MHWGRRGSRGAKFLGSGRGRKGGPRAEAVHTFQGNKGGLARGELVGKPAARAEVPRLDRLSCVDISRSKRKPQMGAELIAAAGRVREEEHPGGTGRGARGCKDFWGLDFVMNRVLVCAGIDVTQHILLILPGDLRWAGGLPLGAHA